MLQLQPDDFKETAIPLPYGYDWKTLDITDSNEIQRLSDFLGKSYSVDEDCSASLYYRPLILEWILMPPNYEKDWHIGVEANGQLVAFISAIPLQLQLGRVAEVNLLCIDRRLRSKHLSAILISELTRRIGKSGCERALYSCGMPIDVTNLISRMGKLIGERISHIQCSKLGVAKYYNKSLKDAVYRNKIAFREMQEKDIKFISSTEGKMSMNWDVESIRHWLLPKDGIVKTYVKLDSDGNVDGYISYYLLNTIKRQDGETTAIVTYPYLFYHSGDGIDLMMRYMMHQLKLAGYGNIICSDIMNNEEMIKRLGFVNGKASLHYYGWNTPEIDSNSVIGIAMV